MAYQSKYTGLQIDDILDSVEWKQGKIEDLASIRAGAQKGATALQSYTEKYTGTVTGIKINGVVKSGSGVIDLGAISTPTKTSQLENDNNFITPEDVAAVALSGSYNDLHDTPTIPSAVTESTVSGWGFTKNTGTITGVSANGTSVATSGVANIPAASTSVYGVTKLSSATNSTSTSLAATASAVKAAYDLANSYKGTVTGVKINGTTKNPSSGVVDLGTVITAHQTLKTINGQSIVGSGDITISGGGSSGGSGAYSEVNHGTSDTTFTLTPNTFHVWDEVSVLTLTLGSETSGVANEFLFQFTSGTTATSLTLPDDIKWAEELVIEPNMIYQVSILKGLASVLEFSNVQLISFILNGATYTALQGMTWIDWCNSSYNLKGARVNGNFIYAGAGVIAYNNAAVLPSEVIINNRQYIIAV